MKQLKSTSLASNPSLSISLFSWEQTFRELSELYNQFPIWKKH
jgi:hypothetical protein